eukprot:TRINITY_DN81501_c0_g1_i1.p1 TRINITY_DN81501_c0_g1~~TRINITY_DN81501_c0_g1_i1.p1  ORF type:complete len:192 (-),score=13.45 TRINITY_DN81501_c0_g1_i1:98-673(-)
MSVGLLLTKNGVACGAHAKRSALGRDFRTSATLGAHGNDHSYQHLHLHRPVRTDSNKLDPATMFQQSSQSHASIFTSSGPPKLGDASLRSLSRISSEPTVAKLAAISPAELFRKDQDSTAYERVWSSSHTDTSFMTDRSVQLPQTQSMSLVKKRDALAVLEEQQASVFTRDLPRKSSMGYKRMSGGRYWVN